LLESVREHLRFFRHFRAGISWLAPLGSLSHLESSRAGCTLAEALVRIE
jgi:hypothetical protein